MAVEIGGMGLGRLLHDLEPAPLAAMRSRSVLGKVTLDEALILQELVIAERLEHPLHDVCLLWQLWHEVVLGYDLLFPLR